MERTQTSSPAEQLIAVVVKNINNNNNNYSKIIIINIIINIEPNLFRYEINDRYIIILIKS